MSGRVVVHVRENLPEDWPWHLRAFAMLLASYYDEKLGYAWPGMKTLAHDTKKDKSQIREWLRDDRLKSEINYVEGRGQGNKSKFFFPNVPWVAKEDTKGDIKGETKGEIPGGAIRNEGLRTEGVKAEGGGKAAPAPLGRLLIFTRQLLEEIQLPVTADNRNAVRAALECEIKIGKTPEEAYRYILDGALAHSRSGLLNRFFFEDARWRQPAPPSQGNTSESIPSQQNLQDDRIRPRLREKLAELYRAHQGNISDVDPAPEGRVTERWLFEMACQRTGIPLERGLRIIGAEMEGDRSQKKLPRAVNE